MSRAYAQQHARHGGAGLQVLGGQDEHVGCGGGAHLHHHVAGHGALVHFQQQVRGQAVVVRLQQVVGEGHGDLGASQLVQTTALVLGRHVRSLGLLVSRVDLVPGRLALLVAAGLSALFGLGA